VYRVLYVSNLFSNFDRIDVTYKLFSPIIVMTNKTIFSKVRYKNIHRILFVVTKFMYKSGVSATCPLLAMYYGAHTILYGNSMLWVLRDL